MRRSEKWWRLRVGVEDRPGALATLATTLGVHDVDVLRIDVVSRDEVAVDDIWIELPPGGSIESLDLVLRRVPGVAVRALFPVAEAEDPVSVMAAACAIAAGATTLESLRATAAEGARHVGGAEHALLIAQRTDGSMDVIASTCDLSGSIAPHEPCLARDAAFGGQPLAVPGSYPWGPEKWQISLDAAWVAAVPFMSAGTIPVGVMLIRERAFAFESGELSRLTAFGHVMTALMTRYESHSSMAGVASRPDAGEVLIGAP